MASISPSPARIRPENCPPERWLSILLESIPDEVKLNSCTLAPAQPIDQEEVAKLLYKPIHSWQTRLLCLQPGSFAEPLQCQLCPVDIIQYEGVVIHESKERVSYEALSYTWGKPVFTRLLTCNGLVYPITQNLFSALQHLRLPNVVRYLWLDAVCINQHDNSEKSSQVGRMMDIYHKAQRVIVWLGGIDGGEAALDFIFMLDQELATVLRLANHASPYFNLLQRIYLIAKQLYSHSWLGRTWIRQEVFAARDLVVVCAGRQLDWKAFCGGRERVANLERELTASVGGEKPANAPMTRVGEQVEILASQNTNLLDVLVAASKFKEANARDKVYAVLGMTGIDTNYSQKDILKHNKTVEIDYSKSVSQVYQDITKYLINECQQSRKGRRAIEFSTE